MAARGKKTVADAGERPSGEGADAAADHRNEVHLVGRLAAEPIHRELPSGDVLVSFRLVVGRPAVRRRKSPPGVERSRAPTVDALECAGWRADVQRALGSYQAGDLLEVTGALRRRFWRGPTGPVSGSEVEVMRVKRIARG